jgi:hypothetical protein
VQNPQSEQTDGYHGTTLERAVKILQEGFKVTPTPEQYWGDGAYFYEKRMQDALDWAERRCAISGEKRAVIQSVVELGDCLNLDDQDHRDLVRETWENLSEKGVKTVTMAVAINALADILGLDTVRVRYESKASKLFTGARLFSRVQWILVVRNLQRILNSKICFQD